VAIEAILGEPDLSQVVLSATPLNQRITKWTWLHNGAFEAVHEGAVTDAVKKLRNQIVRSRNAQDNTI